MICNVVRSRWLGSVCPCCMITPRSGAIIHNLEFGMQIIPTRSVTNEVATHWRTEAVGPLMMALGGLWFETECEMGNAAAMLCGSLVWHRMVKRNSMHAPAWISSRTNSTESHTFAVSIVCMRYFRFRLPVIAPGWWYKRICMCVSVNESALCVYQREWLLFVRVCVYCVV